VTAVMANDPWTGRQVKIDPAAKTVIWEGGFLLPGFTVKGYQTVTIKPASPARPRITAAR
jgi:hypothetical protein